jgi:CDGSH-type Zn-finger protein
MTGARITVYPDGPLIVRGDFAMDDIENGPIHTERIVALCRCGRSARKPLCDGSHKVRARSAPAPKDHAPGAADDGAKGATKGATKDRS